MSTAVNPTEAAGGAGGNGGGVVTTPPPPLDIDVSFARAPAAAPSDDGGFFSWAGEIVASFFPWPIIIILLFLTQKKLRDALSTFFDSMTRFREIGFGDFKLILDTDRASEYVVAYSAVEHAKLQKAFDTLKDKRGIQDLQNKLVDAAIKPKLK